MIPVNDCSHSMKTFDFFFLNCSFLSTSCRMILTYNCMKRGSAAFLLPRPKSGSLLVSPLFHGGCIFYFVLPQKNLLFLFPFQSSLYQWHNRAQTSLMHNNQYKFSYICTKLFPNYVARNFSLHFGWRETGLWGLIRGDRLWGKKEWGI